MFLNKPATPWSVSTTVSFRPASSVGPTNTVTDNSVLGKFMLRLGKPFTSQQRFARIQPTLRHAAQISAAQTTSVPTARADGADVTARPEPIMTTSKRWNQPCNRSSFLFLVMKQNRRGESEKNSEFDSSLLRLIFLKSRQHPCGIFHAIFDASQKYGFSPINVRWS
jgi:hypothetical protein